MALWETRIYSFDKKSGDVLTFEGERIEAISAGEAQHIANTTGRGYLKVTGMKVIEDVDFKTGKRTIYDSGFGNN